MKIETVLADVAARGLVASLKDGAAREAIALGGWEGARQIIVASAAMNGVGADDALAAFGLPSLTGARRQGRGRGPKRLARQSDAKAARR